MAEKRKVVPGDLRCTITTSAGPYSDPCTIGGIKRVVNVRYGDPDEQREINSARKSTKESASEKKAQQRGRQRQGAADCDKV